MSGLVLAADMSVPPDSYTILPAGVRVVLGYVGGATPHVWTAAEAHQAQAAGYVWWPIWTAPNPNHVLTAADGAQDAIALATVLPRYGYPPGRPVFWDIERSTYDASPAGAHAAVSAWRATMGEAGWPAAYPYCNAIIGQTWLADWTGGRPASLPAGTIGVQYQGSSTHPGYDLSVFDPALLTAGDDVSAQDVWQYPISLGDKAKDPSLGYTQPAYRAEQLLSDVSWRSRDTQNRLVRLQRAVANLAAAPAGQVDAEAVVRALAAALADDTPTS